MNFCYFFKFFFKWVNIVEFYIRQQWNRDKQLRAVSKLEAGQTQRFVAASFKPTRKLLVICNLNCQESGNVRKRLINSIEDRFIRLQALRNYNINISQNLRNRNITVSHLVEDLR